MSKQSVMPGLNGSLRPAAYFGKIPLSGDFVTQRIRQDTISIWDNWLRLGLLNTQGQVDGDARNGSGTIWNFVMPPAICGGQFIGLIGDSHDRVGRRYPFTLFYSLPTHAATQPQLDALVPFFMQHARVMRALQLRQMNVDQLESTLREVSDWRAEEPQQASGDAGGDIFSVLGIQSASDDDDTVSPPLGGMLPWPGLQLAEVMQGHTSYWWTNQTLGGPLRAFTHTGGLNETLFKTLFSPLQR